ncbi:MAG: phosphate ABC transporter permease PstA [Planctomycetota bacterium]
MQLPTRNLIDRSFTAACMLSIVFMSGALVVLLGPIFVRGLEAFFFYGTVEHRESQLKLFDHGDSAAVEAELAAAREARQPLFDRIRAFEEKLDASDVRFDSKYRDAFETFKDELRNLLGPLPGGRSELIERRIYGATRWDQALEQWHEAMYVEKWVPETDESGSMLVKKFVPRRGDFEGSGFASAFDLLTEEQLEKMMRPQFTFYWGFLFDESRDAHFFGGIGPEVLGTIYLTLGAMLFAVPIGVIAAIYLAEYSKDGWVVSLIRSCISTLAGVPSIVFGLFGLAFFIIATPISDNKSVLAGSLTLALLVLPTIIRAAEEAIRAVPHTYKEASMGLGASHWRTICMVILPAALPGILTGIVISMGRAAGETAPIIFTAAVSLGRVPAITEVASAPTPALPWNVYNLCTEHEAVDQIRHVQYGMVLTLVAVVLALNLFAIYLRARISKKLRG